MMALRPSGARVRCRHECKVPAGSVTICLSGWSGSRRRTVGMARRTWSWPATLANYYFPGCEQYDRRLRNPEEHAGSITVPALASNGD
jgi:hypothetical protein